MHCIVVIYADCQTNKNASCVAERERESLNKPANYQLFRKGANYQLIDCVNLHCGWRAAIKYVETVN